MHRPESKNRRDAKKADDNADLGIIRASPDYFRERDLWTTILARRPFAWRFDGDGSWSAALI